MLRISRLADYATVLMTHLAKNDTKALNARELAEACHLTVATVSKLLKQLTQVGLLSSQRGPQGGYALARAVSDITVAEIVFAIDGEIGLTECSHADSDCSIEANCDIRGSWQVISAAVRTALERVSLADLIATETTMAKVDVADIGVMRG